VRKRPTPYVSRLVATITLLAVCQTAVAKTRKPPVTLLVVTTPVGEGEAAGLARSLVPATVGKAVVLKNISDLAPSAPGQMDQATVDTLARAQAAALAFRLTEAAELRRQAADALLGSALVASNPALVAEQLIEAGAASLEAGEGDLARATFRKALAVDSAARPGDRISPEARQLFDEVRGIGPSHVRTPHGGVLKALCGQYGAGGILWISVGHDRDGLFTAYRYLLLKETESEPATSQRAPGEPDRLDEWRQVEQARLKHLVSLKIDKERKRAQPLKKKWWLYVTVAGALAAGAAAGVAIYYAVEPGSADVTVHY
jgi:hypothetical protein